ncbi:hypothetical protein GQ44DRAFT_788926 [Phaeosphaeriaceae sp. PMI808]|nr:hypothetical protein GQ44DRAFT_788926 [Phaeosphaeriaceae sp. PMI808]
MHFHNPSSILNLALIHGCVAHMILKHPIPYGNATLNSSPLSSSGLDFPCKLREGVYELSQMNYWVAGEAQTVRFKGTAVHGGGSCQFSLTNDTQPTKASKWKVIHSVIGGCPAKADGNLLEDTAGQGLATFDVLLPRSIPSGKYTFAWTWFNRQGLREMYMNCAPISVSGGENDVSFLETLPDMFVANLPNTVFSTIEGFDYVFPEPGVSVETNRQAKLATTHVGSDCASATPLGAVSARICPTANSAHNSPERGINKAAVHNRFRGNVRSKAMSTVELQMLSSHSTLKVASEGCALPQPLTSGTVCLNGQILRRGARLSPDYGSLAEESVQ